MSVSILIQPGAIVSAYRPVLFKVQSSVNLPELQIRGELYARNGLSDPFTLITTKYEKKYLGNSYFIFDFANALQAQLTFDRLTATQVPGVIHPNTNSVVEYKVKFTEVYYNANGLPADYAYTWATVTRAVNAIPQHDENQTLVDYIIEGGTPDGPFSMAFDNGFN